MVCRILFSSVNIPSIDNRSYVDSFSTELPHSGRPATTHASTFQISAALGGQFL